MISAFRSCLIRGRLNGGIYPLPRFILEESIDKLPRLILKKAGRGGNDGLRGGDAHEGDPFSPQLPDHIRPEDLLPAAGEIAADVREIRHPRQGEELFHAVIELMVPGNRRRVAQPIHEPQDRFSLRHRPHRLALDAVPVVHQEHRIALGDQGVPHLLEPGIAEAFIDAAVDVAGVEDHGASALPFRDQKVRPDLQDGSKLFFRHRRLRHETLTGPGKDPVHDRPLHSLIRPRGDLVCVQEAQGKQPIAPGRLIQGQGAAIQHHGHLFQGNRIIRSESAVSVAVDDAPVHSPADRRSKRPVRRNIRKRGLALPRSRIAAHFVERGEKLSPGQRCFRLPIRRQGMAGKEGQRQNQGQQERKTLSVFHVDTSQNGSFNIYSGAICPIHPRGSQRISIVAICARVAVSPGARR